MIKSGNGAGEYPALSVKQPWAELILEGKKTIEIRTWAVDYRGPVWLHTGKSPDEAATARFGSSPLFLGGFVGIVTIEEIVPFDRERWEKWRPQHLDNGDRRPNFLAWLLSDVRRLDNPLPARGGLKLFTVDPAIERTLLSRLQSPF